MTNAISSRQVAWISFALAIVLGLILSATVAGPGLTWDEPAYRYSQLRLQEWIRSMRDAPSWDEVLKHFSADSIDFYWEYNRFGPNFHPPMAAYLNLLTHGLTGWAIDDLSSRRIASALELAATCGILCYFLGRRYGWKVGLMAGLCLATTPRVVGDAHIAGTDNPLMFFWTAAALAFVPALQSRGWQWLLSGLLALLFLVKFNGLVILLPLALAWVAVALRTPRMLPRWLGMTAMVSAPLAIVGWMAARGLSSDLLDVHSRTVNPLSQAVALAWAPVVVLIFARRERSPDWPVALEVPWRVIAAAPLVAIALNPTWWHDPLGGLARFFELNIGRKGYLPDISIFYLGKQYVYSLPLLNAWVLMAVTIPFGILNLGVVGAASALKRVRRDPLPCYLLLHAITLPAIRMLPVPAHDGVRLFLPTFAFWAALAALGAYAIAQSWPRHSRWIWLGAFVIGPAWGAVEVVRFHPYELSYYNIGLKQAQRLGFEVTYWYDAVTPRVLEDLNEHLPHQAVAGFPSRRINPEVFQEHQSQGRLRGDIDLDVSLDDGFPYILLLTHSSKADRFSQLLYALQPWYASEFQGVRLFSVVDPKTVATAWALHALLFDFEDGPGDNPIAVLDERILELEPGVIAEALRVVRHDGAASADPEVRRLVARWKPGKIRSDLARAWEIDPDSVARALKILTDRREDLGRLLSWEGYPLDSDFNGPWNVE